MAGSWMMGMMRRAVFSVLLVLALASAPSLAKDGDKERASEMAYAAFEFYCLGFLSDFGPSAEALATVGEEISHTATGKAFLAPHGGRVWLVVGRDRGITVALADTGTCSVFSPDAAGDQVRSLLEKFVTHRKQG